MTNADEFNSRLDEALNDAPGVLADLKGQRDRIDIEITRVEKFLKAMVAPEPKRPRGRPKATAKRRSRSNNNASVRATDQTLARTILMFDGDEFTVEDIWHLSGEQLSKGTVAQAFRRFRVSQFIGKMGNKTTGGQMWKIMDTTAAEQYTTTSTEA